MRERQGILTNLDITVFLLWLILTIAGCFTVYSATSMGESIEFFDLSAKHGKQLIFWVVSLVLMFIILSLDYKFITRSSFLIYGAAMLLLLLTLVIGAEINGSKSWIKFGSFQIQPAEFAKLATALALAKFFGTEDKPFRNRKNYLIIMGIIGLPMLLILLQGDFGSTMIYLILIFVLYREGLSPVPIYLGFIAIAISLLALYFGFAKVAIGIAVLTGILFWRSSNKRKSWKLLSLFAVSGIGYAAAVNFLFTNVLKEYQQDRILVLLGMKEDLRGVGYNVWQSKMAVGSGGLLGKGFKNGSQTQGDFVPEVSTDYIFASIGEEWGFIGALFVIGLFGWLIYRLLFLAERQRSAFSRVFIYSVACFFFMHVFVNVAMAIDIFPSVGIPLPFFSYGGSSLLSFSLMLAMVMRLDAERLYVLR